jgi:hypothetical protein
MKKRFPLCAIFLLMTTVTGIASAFAQTNLTMTVDGVIYSNVVFTGVTETEVSFRHSAGATTIALDALPSELQKLVMPHRVSPPSDSNAQQQVTTSDRSITDTEQQVRTNDQSIAGAFGVKFGTKVDVSQYRAVGSMEDGTPYYAFSPNEPVAGMTRYCFLATPKTGIIYRIWATQDFEGDGVRCDDRQAVLSAALRKKYNAPRNPDFTSDHEEIRRASREITCDCKGSFEKIGFVLRQFGLMSKVYDDDIGFGHDFQVTLDYIDYDLQGQAEKERDDIQKQVEKRNEENLDKYLDNESKKVNGAGL